MIAASAAAVLALVLIVLNERLDLFSQDHFPTRAHKLGAYGLLIGSAVVVAALIAESSQAPADAEKLASLPFWSVFSLHAILVCFLGAWWLFAGRPAIGAFFNLRRASVQDDAMTGFAVGVGGWIVTIIVAVVAGLILQEFGQIGPDIKPPDAIPWMAALPVYKKVMIVFSAMTVEELFFRGWLQKRVGLIVSTVAFVIAHAGFGQPLMFIGISVVSILIGLTFYRTKSLLPCIIAHGVFDAIQLFIIIPVAVQFMPK